MKHSIDPKVDCVFKALLGTVENCNLLLHFINAILAQELVKPLTWVEILNPYNEKEFIGDKLSIVDVKAKDNDERVYQIEIQLINHPYLASRIVYNWADIYSSQLKSGQYYNLLKPTYSIWLLAEDLIKYSNNYVHNYKLRDTEGQALNEHGGIWLFELDKFSVNQVESEDQRWLKFFKEGDQLNDETLPDWMNTQEMRQAMNTLSVFSEKERRYFEYQARQEFIRVQRTIQMELERANIENELVQKEKEQLQRENEQVKIENEQVKIEKETEKLQKEEAIQEIKKLKALLAQQQNKNA